MKILFYALTRNQGGIENFIYNYYRWMDKKDIHLTLMAMDDKVVYEEELSRAGAKIVHLPAKRNNRYPFYKCMEKNVKDGSYDAVWFNDNNLCDIQLLRFAKRYRVPVRICHSHNSALTAGQLKLSIHKWNSRHIKKYATDLWACSDKAAEWAFGEYWQEKNVQIVPNAIDTEKFRYKESVRKKMRDRLRAEGKFVVGHVGRFCEAKNHKFLLEIFSQIVNTHPDSMLILVGKGEFFEQVKLDIQKRNLVSKVKLLGQREDVSDLIQSFDAVIMPSLYEGFPVAVVEAQAAGLPCVVADTITREVNITGAVHYMSLQDSPLQWGDSVLQAAREADREAVSEKISDSNYNIRKAAQMLELWFKRRIR